jgi:hypothetical protein
MPIPSPDDHTDWTADELLALAALGFHDPLTANPNPADLAAALEDLALSRSDKFNEILRRSQERLDREGGLSTDEVRRRLGLSGP